MGAGVYPPVIIIGMHRSGTSMITGMLQDLGLFVGRGLKKESNYEARFFVEINEWLLQQCGGSWECPEHIYKLLDDGRAREIMVDFLKWHLKTSRAISFLGLPGYLRYKTPANLDFPWSWKDPRNTFTLPLWLEIFPDARVVHIYRHGVDVANSMSVRADKRKSSARKEMAAKSQTMQRSLYSRLFKPKLWGFSSAMISDSLEFAFALWEKYLEESHAHVRNLDDRAVEVRYEDFIADPKGILRRLADFCGLKVTDNSVAGVAGRFKKARAFAHAGNPQLRELADRMADRLKVWGY